MARKFTFPQFLQQPPEQRREEAQRQDLLRASFSRARLTPEERIIARGKALEDIARANVEVQEEKSNAGQRKHTQGQLAEGLALQGRYREAAEVHPLKYKQKEFIAIADAVDRDDEMCACPRTVHKTEQAELSVSPRRKLRSIYSAKHKQVVALMTCDKCKMLNARPITGQAAEVAGHRHASAMAAKQGQVLKINDAHVLK